MKKIDQNKLLEFYQEIYIVQRMEEEEVIKKYGESINQYLHASDIGTFKCAVNFNGARKLYTRNSLAIEETIHQLEEKIHRKNQEKLNKLILFAISLQALVAFLAVRDLDTIGKIIFFVIPLVILWLLFRYKFKR